MRCSPLEIIESLKQTLSVKQTIEDLEMWDYGTYIYTVLKCYNDFFPQDQIKLTPQVRGRLPDKKEKLMEYLEKHPNASTSEISHDLRMSTQYIYAIKKSMNEGKENDN
jgi:asparagine N-glycosylation enzyme membrane subunit Stt3